MSNNITPLLTTPHFIVTPLVPVSLAWSSLPHQSGTSTYTTTATSSNSEKKSVIEEPIENIEEWLEKLSEKSLEHSRKGNNGRRQHKRHR